MDFLDKLEFYLDDELINLIVLKLYRKYVETLFVENMFMIFFWIK